MINGPIILGPLENLDRFVAPRSGAFRTPSASIGDYKDKIESVLSDTVDAHRALLGTTLLAVLCLLGGCATMRGKEETKKLPATIEFQKSSLNGFDV